MHDRLVHWSDVRDELMTPQEQIECQAWLNELGKLMDARDAGKLNVKEYCRLCFELDKKYGLADEEDAALYLGEDDEPDADEDVENDFDAPLTFVGA